MMHVETRRRTSFAEALHAAPASLATKVAACFTVVTLLALLFLGLTFARRETMDLRRTVHEDLRAQGRALAPTIRDIWLREGLDRARVAVAAANGDAETVRISLEPRAGVTSASPDVVRVEVPVRTPEGVQMLQLERRAPGLATAIRGELGLLLLVGLLAASGVVALSFALCEWLIARPLRRIVAHARSIADGHLGNRLTERGSAEVASLKRELNGMADALEAAQKRADAEAVRRNAATEALRHADRLKTVGTLAAGIAHELGTPLNVVLILARRLARERRGDTRTVADTAEIEAQVRRMTDITRQLLDFASRREPRRHLIAVDDLVVRVAAMLEGLARAKNCSIAIEHADAPGDVSADADALQQVLTNLIVNAFDAMPSGGVVTLRARSANDARAVRIDVEDSGHGMPAHIVERIFEPFFTTKDVGRGTGLGLCVAHGIVADHGGRLDVVSTAGSGTTVSVLLPRSTEAVDEGGAMSLTGRGPSFMDHPTAAERPVGSIEHRTTSHATVAL